MTLQKLREALLQEAHREAQGILRAAEEETHRLLDAEKTQGALRKKEADAQLERSLATYRQERLAWTHLEVRRIEAEAREDAIHAVVDELYELLETRKGPAYAEFLRRTLDEAVRAVGADSTVHILQADATRFKSGTLGKFRVQTDLPADTCGGLIAETPDGKIRFNGTLQARIELLHEELRKRIYEKLLGKEPKKEAKRGSKQESAGGSEKNVRSARKKN